TVAAGQHAIDDQHVIIHARGHRIAGFAVGGMVGHMARFVQCLDQIARRFTVILDQQNLQRRTLQLKRPRNQGSGADTHYSVMGSPMKRASPSRATRTSAVLRPLLSTPAMACSKSPAVCTGLLSTSSTT